MSNLGGQRVRRALCGVADERWLLYVSGLRPSVALLGTPVAQGAGAASQPQRIGPGLRASDPDINGGCHGGGPRGARGTADQSERRLSATPGDLSGSMRAAS